MPRWRIYRCSPMSNLRRELLDWYRNQFVISTCVSCDPGPQLMNCGLVANVTKHAEGGSANDLRTLHPTLFIPPCFDEQHPESVQFSAPVSRPLAGDDLYVTPDILQEYCERDCHIFV